MSKFVETTTDLLNRVFIGDTEEDTEVKISKQLPKKVAGKTILITGASSGIGLATALKLAKAGATLLLVARGEENLLLAQQQCAEFAADVQIYPTDLNDMQAIDKLVSTVLEQHGHVDILINNAGRSIRRSVWESLDRFHDFERTMQLNYFAPVRLIMGLMPAMKAAGGGQVINISSIGCLTNVPRFSAYVASKSALDAFSRTISAEVRDANIALSTIYMPLVRTPMIAPTKMYKYVPTYSPQQAGDLVADAIVDKPKSIKSPLGTLASVSYSLWPKVNDAILSEGFKLFPSSTAARGDNDADVPGPRSLVFARIFKGVHW